ncbi:EAL domain-containing protein [Lacibacterium aquatile]|uniref:EAL domain-containing protein n=1 Tax=Lacibacterium aquatile TaxID=1168082 RepID=A0ABW5DX48_9PROT
MLGFIAPIAYAAVAFVVMFAAPSVLGDGPVLDANTLGILLGVIILISGFLVQEIITRRSQANQTRTRFRALLEQMSLLREEVRALRDGQRAASAAGGDAAEIETVVAEMRMLKTLVNQIGTGPARSAAAPAAARPAAAGGSGIAPIGPASGTQMPAGLPPLSNAFAPEPEGEPMDYADTRSDEEVILDVVREALAEERMELSLQPIVSLPSRRLAVWECQATVRTAEGLSVPPETYAAVAERAGLAATINNMLLVRSVQFVRRMRRQKATIGYICPIAGETLRDRAFFADFLGFMQENRDLAGLLSFSIGQQDVFHFDARTDADVTALGGLGFRFVLDKVSNLDLFVSDLSNKGFRTVKIPAHMLLAKHGKISDPRALKRKLDTGAIDIMVSGVVADNELVDLLDFAVDYGQGALFGASRPAESKSEILYR